MLLVCLWCFICFYRYRENATAKRSSACWLTPSHGRLFMVLLNFAASLLRHTPPQATGNIQGRRPAEGAQKPTGQNKRENRSPGGRHEEQAWHGNKARVYVCTRRISHKAPIAFQSVNRVRKGTWLNGLTQEVDPPNRRSASRSRRACTDPSIPSHHSPRRPRSRVPSQTGCVHARTCACYENIMPLKNVSSRFFGKNTLTQRQNNICRRNANGNRRTSLRTNPLSNQRNVRKDLLRCEK